VAIGARTRTPWPAIAGVIATVSVFAIAQGLSYPLLSFILERQGTSSALIGLSAAMTPLGIVASAPLIPPLARRFGAGATALCCAGLAALLLALIGWAQDVSAWFALRFLLGVAINPLYVLSEVWIIALTPPSLRGRVMGIYTAIISAGFAAGPLTLILVGSEGWPPFLVGITAFLLCGLCLASVVKRLPKVDDGRGEASVRRFLPEAPVLLLAVVVASAFEQAALSLLPVYGLAYGLGEAGMAAFLTVLIAGNIALQVPLGLAAERLTPRTVLTACAAGTALGCLLLPSLIGTPLQWPLAFIWGALSYGIYTIALVELGARFSGSMLIAGNAAFALMWGAGGMAGPAGAGAMMGAIGVQGLPVTLGLLCLVLAALAFIRRR
jgi:predicted MFS family arabinose efflux permease